MPLLSRPMSGGSRLEWILLPVLVGVVLVVAALFYVDFNLIRSARREADRLQRVLAANEVVLSTIKDLETAQRGYLLTGNADYLAPYRKAKDDLPGMLDALRQEAALYPDQRERVMRLRSLVQEKLTEVDATLLIRDQAGSEAALAIVQTDQGRLTMEAIRRNCDEIRAANYSRMATNSADLESRFVRSRFAVMVGCGVLAGLLVLALTLIHKASDRRETLVNELEEARLQFQVTLSSIGDGVITVDESGLVTFLNPTGAQITGWNPAEALGQPLEAVFQTINEVTGEKVESPIRQVLRERKPVKMANQTGLVRPGGATMPIDDSATPIFDGRHNLAGAVMVFRDVTERRAVELALRRWEHIFEHAGFGMAVFSPAEQPLIEQANPAFASMHGYLPDELVGLAYERLVAPEVWPVKPTLLDGTTRADHTVTETIHVRKDGTRFPAMADFTIVRDEHGKATYCMGYYLDISDRKRAEDELRQSEARYRTTADSLPHMIWTSQPDGKTDFVNQRWEEETGLTLEQTGPEGWTRILAPEDREDCLAKWRDALGSGETFQAECRLLSVPRGESRWHTCRAVPIRDGTGRILRWFGSCMDIHEQKLAAENVRASKEELQLANEALKRSNMDLEQFAYAASHDLQEPLRMVNIYSQLLKEECGDKLDGQGREYLNFAVSGATRMEALLKDLLDYSRAVGPEESRLPEEIDCQEALNEALANMSTSIQETNAEVSRAALPRVHMPKVHLVQVFQNLVGNAIKYRKPGEKPMIHVDARPQDGTWIFSVRDNGVGIAPQFHKQIFRIFGRLHGTETPGTGIGLALCKKLVERAGGTIWVESQPDAGSVFYFTVRA